MEVVTPIREDAKISKVVVHAPGAVAANTNITLPTEGRQASRIMSAIRFAGSDGTAAAVATNLTVVTGVPGAGEIRLVDQNTYELGDAMTTRDFVVLVLDLYSKRKVI